MVMSALHLIFQKRPPLHGYSIILLTYQDSLYHYKTHHRTHQQNCHFYLDFQALMTVDFVHHLTLEMKSQSLISQVMTTYYSTHFFPRSD